MKSNLIVYLLLTGVGIAALHALASVLFSEYNRVFMAIGAKLVGLTQ